MNNTTLKDPWFKLAEVFKVLKKCRVSIISVILVGFVSFSPQARDAFCSMAQSLSQSILFEISLLLCAFFIYAGGRFILNQDFKATRDIVKLKKDVFSKRGYRWYKKLSKEYLFKWPDKLTEKGFDNIFNAKVSKHKLYDFFGERYIPQVLGLLCFIAINIAMFKAVKGISSTNGINYIYVVNIVATIIFLYFFRRHCIKSYKNQVNRITYFLEYTPLVKILIAVASGISLVGWVLPWLFLQKFAPFMGTVATLLMGCSFLIVIFSWVAWASELSQIPVLTGILLIVLIAGITDINNNHDVRKSDAELSEPQKGFFTPDKLYESWLEKMDTKYRTETVHPMFIVAASGGGIRAAYWTASVLGMLQDKNEHFASHTIVISPVSGSALGSLVFVNLLANNFEQGKYAAISQTVLSRDFLAPALASFFFYDLPTRPFPAKYLNIRDRAEALEKAWESAWYPKNSNNSSESLLKDFLGKESPFSKPFSSLLQSERNHEIPILLINGTLVETGERIIVAHLNIKEAKDENKEKNSNKFSCCKNLLDISPYNNSDIRMSTVAMMSARFPIISPVGTIDSDHHVVDGGYYDNSGASTALDFYESIESIDREKVIPIFIQIDNSDDENTSLSWWNKIFSGVQFPFIALRKTGDAHAKKIKRSVEEIFQDSDGKKRYFQYTLQNKGVDVNVPLSWFLSSKSQEYIQNQLAAAKKSTTTAAIINILSKASKQRTNTTNDVE